ncbi:DUF3078 domain-containing protein [Flavobacterium sp. W1B]|uniref:DUF3078 domain-containing protein n=1 Tax=Flavobacterium sp. W1B TaxID=3394146 RepID=UPI0039BC9E59
MKSARNALLLLFLIFSTNSFAQDIVSPKPLSAGSNWKGKNTVGFDFSEIAFMNWSSGGESSISGLLKGTFVLTYSNNNLKWVEELVVRYGVNKQDGLELRKTDDALRYNSTIGYRRDSTSNWYHSAKFTFNTQFTNGYKYPNREIAISRLFAPAYTFLGAGAEYSNKKKDENLYISPVTMKNTLVLDQTLANQGAFGVTKAAYDLEGNLIYEGKRSKTELGFLITSYLKKEIVKNIIIENRLSLYSDYINNFGNVDIDCNTQLNLVVNQYVRANIGAHFVYDDDIKTKEEINGVQQTLGPKLQLKQILGIGLEYVF